MTLYIHESYQISKHTKGRGFPVPKGAVVSLNVYALHRNPKHYPDPDAFKYVDFCFCFIIIIFFIIFKM